MANRVFLSGCGTRVAELKRLTSNRLKRDVQDGTPGLYGSRRQGASDGHRLMCRTTYDVSRDRKARVHLLPDTTALYSLRYLDHHIVEVPLWHARMSFG
jgi:hypothetical protein